ncbi:MAG TPA: ABC transporter permease, partial [Thermoanaerobaculia bacterium]
MGGWWQDLRFAVRSLRRRPEVTLLALFTMALSIGANTAIFSVVQGVLLAPLPLPHPEELVAFLETAPKAGLTQMACSPLDFSQWRERSRSFVGLAAYHWRHATLTGGGEPEALAAFEVSGDF